MIDVLKKNKAIWIGVVLVLGLLIVQACAVAILGWGKSGDRHLQVVPMAHAADSGSNLTNVIKRARELGACQPDSGWASATSTIAVSCPPSNAGEGAYRLQVKIPGVGETCYYPGTANKISQWEVKACNYMPGDKDLRHWIVEVYKFGVGLALALAVLMIMVGGFQRILAAGASQKISNANTTIIAAISGAVLALGSYALLYTLDVRLTQFKKLEVATLTGFEQLSGMWCDSDENIKLRDQLVGQGKTFKVYQIGKSREMLEIEDTKCGFEYRMVRDGKDVSGNYGVCYGRNGCDEAESFGRDKIEACIQMGPGLPICANAKAACEVWTGSGSRNYSLCKSVDDQFAYFRKNFSYGCGWEKDVFIGDWGAKDDCGLKKLNECASGFTRVECSHMTDSTKENVCVKEANEKGLTCVAPPLRSVSGASTICCVDGDGKVVSVGEKGAKECKDLNNTTGIRSYIKDSANVENCQTHESTLACRSLAGCVVQSVQATAVNKACKCASCRDILSACPNLPYPRVKMSCINSKQCSGSYTYGNGTAIDSLIKHMNNELVADASGTKYPGLKGQDLVITSITDDHTLMAEGWEKCQNNHDSSSCVHKQYSCHYGGMGKKDWSYAVDIRLIEGADEDIKNLVNSYIRTNNGEQLKLGTYYWEEDHYHISHKYCCCNNSYDPTPGDGCTQADYNKCK